MQSLKQTYDEPPRHPEGALREPGGEGQERGTKGPRA